MGAPSFFVLSPDLSERIWSNVVATEPLESSLMPERIVSLKWEVLLSFFQELRERPVKSEQEFERFLLDLCDVESQLHDAYQHHLALQADENGAEAAKIFEVNIARYELLWENQRQYVYERINAMPWMQNSKPEWERLSTVIKGRVQNFNWDHYSLESEEARVVEKVKAWEYMTNTETFAELSESSDDREIWCSEDQVIRSHEAEVLPLISDLISIRQAQANLVGSDYLNYVLTGQDTHDYSADNVVEFARAILDHFSPLVAQCLERRLVIKGESHILPWHDWSDLEIPYDRKLDNADVLESRLREFLARLSPGVLELFDKNRSKFSLDFYEREQKDNESFISSYARLGKFYLTTNLNGSAESLSDVFHETSHLLETVAAAHHQNYHYRNHPPEIAEGLAMAMELIAMEHSELFFRPVLQIPARRQALEEQILLLTQNAAETLFGAWLYSDDGATKVDQWGARWSELADKAMPGVDWSEYTDSRRILYLSSVSMLTEPFSGLNYVLGGVNALSLFLNYRKDRERTTSQILQAYRNGDSQSLPLLYERAGIPFRFDGDFVKSLADSIGSVLRSY